MRPMQAIIRADLWQRRWSLLWWTIGVAAMVGIDTMLYQTIKGEAVELGKLFDQMPKAVSALFADGSNLLSQPGFLSGRVYYLLLPLLLTIFTVGFGAGLIKKEEGRGTLELLLARPIGRTRLLVSKMGVYAAALLLLGVTVVIVGATTLRPAGLDEIPMRGVLFAGVQAVLLSSLFGALAFALAALGKPFSRAAAGIAALVAFISYLTASLESLASWLVWPARLMPYHYYHPTAILRTGNADYRVLAGYLAVLAVLAAMAIIGFRRRDIG